MGTELRLEDCFQQLPKVLFFKKFRGKPAEDFGLELPIKANFTKSNLALGMSAWVTVVLCGVF